MSRSTTSPLTLTPGEACAPTLNAAMRSGPTPVPTTLPAPRPGTTAAPRCTAPPMPETALTSAAAPPPDVATPLLHDAAALLSHDAAALLPHDPWGQRFDAWREAAAVHWQPQMLGGAWVVGRHADCQAGLRDARLSVRRTGAWLNPAPTAGEASGAGGAPDALRALQALAARALLFVEPPDHGRLRQLLAPAFTPAALQALAPQIEADVQTLLDAAAPVDGVLDVVAALARPLPARVIGRLLGLADTDAAEYLQWSQALADLLSADQPSRAQALAAQQAVQALAARCEQAVAAAAAASDLASTATAAADSAPLAVRLGAALHDGRLHNRTELLAQCAMLLFAGYETTRHLLASLLAALLQPGWAAASVSGNADADADAGNPAPPATVSAASPWQALRAALLADEARGRAAVADWVREVLRRDSPLRYTARRVTTDFVWHGQTLRRGDRVVLLLGAALRDPRQYAQPLALQPGRGSGWALAFGSGPHVCLGAALTQLEAETVVCALLRRWTAPQLAATPTAADWLDDPLYRGLRRLRLRVDGAAAPTP